MCGAALAFFNELGAAFGAGDGNFAAALGHAYLLAAVRAGKIAVGFAQGKPLLQLAELGAHTSAVTHKKLPKVSLPYRPDIKRWNHAFILNTPSF